VATPARSAGKRRRIHAEGLRERRRGATSAVARRLMSASIRTTPLRLCLCEV